MREIRGDGDGGPNRRDSNESGILNHDLITYRVGKILV
jgi:hypothetical protein